MQNLVYFLSISLLLSLIMLYSGVPVWSNGIDVPIWSSEVKDLPHLQNTIFRENRRGYNIEIRSYETSESGIDISEVLLIDGKMVPFLKTSEGYRIYYQPPEPDLPSAARSFIDTQREKSE